MPSLLILGTYFVFCSWEPAENCAGCPHLIKEFNARERKKRKRSEEAAVVRAESAPMPKRQLLSEPSRKLSCRRGRTDWKPVLGIYEKREYRQPSKGFDLPKQGHKYNASMGTTLDQNELRVK